MRGLFSPMCRAKNNEEYRAVLRKRQLSYFLCLLAGLAEVGLVLFLVLSARTELSEYRLGYLLGLGGGMVLASALALVRIQRKKASEEKLKAARLQETDERELEVDSLALRAAAKLLLGALYGLLVIAGLLQLEALTYVCFGLIGVFLLGYALFHRYYCNKI